MPRYFIHLRNPDLWLEDCEGRDLPDLHAALAETQKANNSLPAVAEGSYGLEFEIMDSEGFVRLRVPVQKTQHPDASPQACDGRGSGDAPDCAPLVH